MRAILAVAMLLLGVSTAMPEPEYFAMAPGSFHLGGTQLASLVQIETDVGKADRQAIVTPPVARPDDQTLTVPSVASKSDTHNVSPANFSPANVSTANVSTANVSPEEPPTLDQLCHVLLSSAEDNDLPVPFFANLIWQESGLRNDIVSSKGAMGIAQFMPERAHESGLANPFDPLQALPASARLLRDLRAQFGNLGFAAAAYNAGPKRVSDWLAHGGTLPRETREYVVDVTGRSADEWRKTPPADADLHFVRALPCRELPAFAELELAQPVAAPPPAQQEKSDPSQAAKPQPDKPKNTEPPARAEHKRERREARERKVKEHEVKEHVHRGPHGRHKQA
jgi:hypothetical protein